MVAIDVNHTAQNHELEIPAHHGQLAQVVAQAGSVGAGGEECVRKTML
jgi:hypothetical protein